MKAILHLFDFQQKVNYKTEILSGLTVALALVPEAVAFALIAGLSPLTGLYAAFVMGLVTSIFGGRPGMISGATGAVAVVLVSLVKSWSRIRVCNRYPSWDFTSFSRCFKAGEAHEAGTSSCNLWVCKWLSHYYFHVSIGPI